MTREAYKIKSTSIIVVLWVPLWVLHMKKKKINIINVKNCVIFLHIYRNLSNLFQYSNFSHEIFS